MTNVSELIELTFEKPHDPAQVLDALEADVPALRPVATGDRVGRRPVARVMGDGRRLTLLVPAGTEVAAAAVVAAHGPRPPEPPPDLGALFEDLRAKVAGATTVAGVRAALAALILYEEGKHPERKKR